VQLLDACPGAEVAAHARTLERLSPPLPAGARVRALTDEAELLGGARALYTPGHTDGHLTVWIERSRTLLAGDHACGVGSARLDADSGGDMADYMSSTRRVRAHLRRFASSSDGIRSCKR
jgi:glyoxylase-like metal-dependent hydrolase (beta-lactamase superfamily II)